jgi:hypothetical protein
MPRLLAAVTRAVLLNPQASPESAPQLLAILQQQPRYCTLDSLVLHFEVALRREDIAAARAVLNLLSPLLGSAEANAEEEDRGHGQSSVALDGKTKEARKDILEHAAAFFKLCRTKQLPVADLAALLERFRADGLRVPSAATAQILEYLASRGHLDDAKELYQQLVSSHAGQVLLSDVPVSAKAGLFVVCR